MAGRKRQLEEEGVLFPAGTSLKDVPPDWQGVSWKSYFFNHFLHNLIEEYYFTRPPMTEADMERINKEFPFKTARDNYGWRSL